MQPRSPPPHPGDVLLRKFLHPRGITQVRLCQAIDIAGPYLNRFIKGGSDVNAKLAWKLAQALGTTPRYWTTLQAEHDLWLARPRRRIRRVTGNGRH